MDLPSSLTPSLTDDLHFSLLTVLVSGPDQKMSQHCFECVNQDEPPAMDEDQDEETMDW